MLRNVLLVLAVCSLVAVAAVQAEETATETTEEPVYDIGSALNSSFSDLAKLPTRLTAYNLHDDAATASYTCCRPDQEEQIEQALAANDNFLTLYPGSDFADDALIHSIRVNSVKRDILHEMDSLNRLCLQYPDSDLWDDGMWLLASCLGANKEFADQVDVLTKLVDRNPTSLYAPQALDALAATFAHVKDEPGTLRALEQLAHGYPSSDLCDGAYYRVAEAYLASGDYGPALGAYTELVQRYPMSDYVDDAQFKIAECLRHDGNQEGALNAYRFLLQAMPGSPNCRAAMREINSLIHLHDATAQPDFLDLEAPIPADEAQDLWDYAQRCENYRQYDEAIASYRQFIARFPGHDCYDDAWFHMGACYQETNKLFQKINKSTGPDQLFKLEPEFRAATGMATVPSGQQLSAVEDAVGCYAVVVNNLVGSSLRVPALREIARCYEQSDQPDDAAMTYQEMVIFFPYAFDPDDGQLNGKGAVAKTLRYYADPAHYPDCAATYAALAQAYPEIFPPNLVEDRDTFLTTMYLYQQHADHALEELRHHIPYRFSVDDLQQDARYVLACLNMQRGQYQIAAQQLEPFVNAISSDFSAPATFVYGHAQEALGNPEKAAQAYQLVVDAHPLSGLADDAAAELERLNSSTPPDRAAVFAKISERFQTDVALWDVWDGPNCTVVAPWAVSAKMRQYNQPNIWDQAVASLADWTNVPTKEKTIIYVAGGGGQESAGNPVCVSALAIKDPPQWSLGLKQLADNAIACAPTDGLAACPALADGLGRLASAALQFQLVTETRDTIGSASAVKLPQEEVVNARNAALTAFQEFVRQQSDVETLNGDAAFGLMLTLLDQHGYGANGLVDWQPFTGFFRALAKSPSAPAEDPEAARKLFVTAVNEAFGTDCSDQFREWGFRVQPGRVTRLPG